MSKFSHNTEKPQDFPLDGNLLGWTSKRADQVDPPDIHDGLRYPLRNGVTILAIAGLGALIYHRLKDAERD